MYMHSKMNFLSQAFQKLHRYRERDRLTHKQMQLNALSCYILWIVKSTSVHNGEWPYKIT